MRIMWIRGTSEDIRGYLSPLGSLLASPAAYAALGSAVIQEGTAATEAALQRIAIEAVPEEGDIHPLRATVGGLCIITPAGVTVQFTGGDRPGEIIALVDFGRDSISLAGEITAQIAARRWQWDGRLLREPPMDSATIARVLRDWGDSFAPPLRIRSSPPLARAEVSRNRIREGVSLVGKPGALNSGHNQNQNTVVGLNQKTVVGPKSKTVVGPKSKTVVDLNQKRWLT